VVVCGRGVNAGKRARRHARAMHAMRHTTLTHSLSHPRVRRCRRTMIISRGWQRPRSMDDVLIGGGLRPCTTVSRVPLCVCVYAGVCACGCASELAVAAIAILSLLASKNDVRLTSALAVACGASAQPHHSLVPSQPRRGSSSPQHLILVGRVNDVLRVLQCGGVRHITPTRANQRTRSTPPSSAPPAPLSHIHSPLTPTPHTTRTCSLSSTRRQFDATSGGLGGSGATLGRRQSSASHIGSAASARATSVPAASHCRGGQGAEVDVVVTVAERKRERERERERDDIGHLAGRAEWRAIGPVQRSASHIHPDILRRKG